MRIPQKIRERIVDGKAHRFIRVIEVRPSRQHRANFRTLKSKERVEFPLWEKRSINRGLQALPYYVKIISVKLCEWHFQLSGDV
jgi:hypothetical protein